MLRAGPPAPLRPQHLGERFRKRIRTHLQMTTLGGLEASPHVARGLLDRAQATSTPSEKTLALPAHGTGADAKNARWMDKLCTTCAPSSTRAQRLTKRSRVLKVGEIHKVEAPGSKRPSTHRGGHGMSVRQRLIPQYSFPK